MQTESSCSSQSTTTVKSEEWHQSNMLYMQRRWGCWTTKAKNFAGQGFRIFLLFVYWLTQLQSAGWTGATGLSHKSQAGCFSWVKNSSEFLFPSSPGQTTSKLFFWTAPVTTTKLRRNGCKSRWRAHFLDCLNSASHDSYVAWIACARNNAWKHIY